MEETILGHYRILCRLCRGGMSEVYLAHDENTHHDVAIKLVNSLNSDHIERLQREAEIVTLLPHDHILPCLEYGQQSSWHYLVMPYMELGNLHQHLTKGPLPLKEAGRILDQVASALQFAHDHGFLHRDIKPSNILLGNERHVYLSDFGLAKEIGKDEDAEQNDPGQPDFLMGTPEYMAPELAEEEPGISSDIYALGVLLYQMVTGQLPFTGSSPLSIYYKHIQEPPAPPSQLNPAISPAIEQVILHALEKDPSRRYRTAETLALTYRQAIAASVKAETLYIPAQITIKVRKLSDPGMLIEVSRKSLNFFLLSSRLALLLRSANWSTSRKIQIAIAGFLAILFLLVAPLSLGFLVAHKEHAQPSLLSGASAQSPNPGKTPQVTVTATATPTPTPAGSAPAPLILSTLTIQHPRSPAPRITTVKRYNQPHPQYSLPKQKKGKKQVHNHKRKRKHGPDNCSSHHAIL